jgi:hypothetical protein
MPSIRHFGFGLGIVLSSLGWLSAGSAQEQSAPCQASRAFMLREASRISAMLRGSCAEAGPHNAMIRARTKKVALLFMESSVPLC